MINKTKIEQPLWLEQPAIILLLFTMLVLLIRIFLRGQILELDEAEQVVMAQQLLPGYPDQPPLYSWLQYGFFKLLGPHLVSLALLKSILLFGCLYCFYQICRLHCQTVSLAWCTTLSWVFIPAISLDLIKDNTHSILALFTASLTWYWFIAPSRLSKVIWYLILGGIMGMGFLSKFNYLLFLAILFISALSLHDYRGKLLNSGMLLTLLISFLIASPYIFWLLQHSSIGLRGTYKLVPADKQQWHGLTALIKSSLLFVAPSLLFASIFFPIKQWSSRQSIANSLLVRYHMISLPFLITVVLVAGLRNFETRWLTPIFFLSPAIYLSQVKAKSELDRTVTLFLTLCVVIQFLLFIALIHRSHNGHKIRNQFPLNQVVQIIKNEHQQLDYIVSDSYWLLGNLMKSLSLKGGWLLHPAAQPKLPKGNSLLIWQSAPPPFWVDYFAKSHSLGEIKSIEDPKNHKIVAGYAYVDSNELVNQKY